MAAHTRCGSRNAVAAAAWLDRPVAPFRSGKPRLSLRDSDGGRRCDHAGRLCSAGPRTRSIAARLLHRHGSPHAVRAARMSLFDVFHLPGVSEQDVSEWRTLERDGCSFRYPVLHQGGWARLLQRLRATRAKVLARASVRDVVALI